MPRFTRSAPPGNVRRAEKVAIDLSARTSIRTIHHERWWPRPASGLRSARVAGGKGPGWEPVMAPCLGIDPGTTTVSNRYEPVGRPISLLATAGGTDPCPKGGGPFCVPHGAASPKAVHSVWV